MDKKREAMYDYEGEPAKKLRREAGDSDSDPEASRDEPIDIFYDSAGDSKSVDAFFPLAKKSERKKRHYRGMAAEDSVPERRDRRDRDRRRDRSDRDRRDRDLTASRESGGSDRGRDRGGSRERVERRTNRHSPYVRAPRDQNRHRDRDRRDRDGEGYRREDPGWGGDKEGRRGVDRDRDRQSPREEQYSGGRGGRSPLPPEDLLHLRRRGREGRDRDRPLRDDIGGRDRARGERLLRLPRGRDWRDQPPSDRSPVGQRKVFSGGSGSSIDSREDDRSEHRRGGVELRPESLDNLIKEFEEGKDYSGESGSDISSAGSPLSDRQMRRVKKNRYGDIRHQRDSPGERSGSSSSVGSGRSNEGGSRSGRRYSRSYSRSRSRSPDIQGQPMRSKFDSYEYSDGEIGEEGKGEGRSPPAHPDKLDTERQPAEEEQKKPEDLEAENEKLAAQFAKDMEDEEVEDVDGVFDDLPLYFPALMGCRNVESYEWLNRIEEGTYGVVHRGKDKRTGEIVALKKLKMEKEREGFPITSLREINMLLKAKHPNIVHVKEIVVGSNMDKIFIVMEYVEHDLKNLMEMMSQPFRPGEVKTLIMQLLSAVNHLHDNWILHRDLKASNLLLSHKGILKVGDFGLAREYGSPLKPYTPVVVTLWYRCPELLLGQKEYSTAVDMWSVGCIFAEFIQKEPLFRGKSEIDMLNLIFKELGTPSERIWPGYNKLPTVEKVTFTNYPYNVMRKRFPINILSENGFELLNRFLTYDPKKRVTAADAMTHQYFKEPPMPIPPSMFPTWPAKSEMLKGKKREKSPKPPSGGQNNLLNADDKEGPGFNLKFVPVP